MENKKILVAYFSHKGENYINGKIVDITIGNTKIIAEMIHEIKGGDLFEIETVIDYPREYNITTSLAKDELMNKARPKLKSHIENIDNYDVIYLGFPNWWNTMPMAVFTFLEDHNLSEKTIIPFCTHEGSGMGRSDKDIKNICPNSIIGKSIAIYGSTVKNSFQSIKSWLK